MDGRGRTEHALSPVLIATVLRSGGEYRAEHVVRLRDQVRRFAPGAHFICLSDVPLPVRWTKLEHDWPTWWAKIEVFRLRGPVLYMDLDTTIVGDLAPLLDAVTQRDFIALRDFNPQQREMGSGLMSWSGDMMRIKEAFATDPVGHMKRCSTPRLWGDQGFIEGLTQGRAYWQELVPGAVVSWKKHCSRGVPAGARVVCFHGKPRPWEVGQ